MGAYDMFGIPGYTGYGDHEITDEQMDNLACIVCRLLEEPEKPGEYGGGPLFALAYRLATFGVCDQDIEIALADVVRQVRVEFG